MISDRPTTGTLTKGICGGLTSTPLTRTVTPYRQSLVPSVLSELENPA